MSPQESVWNLLFQEITRITPLKKGFKSTNHSNLVHKFIPMPHAMKIPDPKAAVEKEWEKLEKLSAWQMTKVKSKKHVLLEAQKRAKDSSFCNADGRLSSQERGVRTIAPKIQRASRAPR